MPRAQLIAVCLDHDEQRLRQQQQQQQQQQQRASTSADIEQDEMRDRRMPFTISRDDDDAFNREQKELKRVIIFGGLFFMIVVIFFMLRLNVPIEDVFKWSPVIWVICILVFALLIRLCSFYRQLYKRRQLMRFRRQQSLLFNLGLPHSFPCLAPSPHLHCCNRAALQMRWTAMRTRRCGNSGLSPGSLAFELRNDRRSRASSLPPAYDELMQPPVIPEEVTSSTDRSSSNVGNKLVSQRRNSIDDPESTPPPPAYEEALQMLNAAERSQPSVVRNV